MPSLPLGDKGSKVMWNFRGNGAYFAATVLTACHANFTFDLAYTQGRKWGDCATQLLVARVKYKNKSPAAKDARYKRRKKTRATNVVFNKT